MTAEFPVVPGVIGRPVVSIGVDVVDIDRMRSIVGRQPRFAQRVFTSEERRYCEAAVDPSERFAARFAAKEAGLKALGVGLGGADFVDLAVDKRASGEPVLVVTGRAADRARQLGIGSWLLTLSHSDTVACAVVVGLAEGRSSSDENGR
jgi:holo-[acyl-carrier protein] synthase